MWSKEEDFIKFSSHENLETVPRFALNPQSSRADGPEFEKIEAIDKLVVMQQKLDCLESQKNQFEQTVRNQQDRIKELETQAITHKKAFDSALYIKSSLEKSKAKQLDQQGFDKINEKLQERVQFLESALQTAANDKLFLQEELQIMASEKTEALMRIADLELGESRAPSRTNLIEMTPLELAESDLLKAQETEILLNQSLAMAKNEATHWKLKHAECEKKMKEEDIGAKIQSQTVQLSDNQDKVSSIGLTSKKSAQPTKILESTVANHQFRKIEVIADLLTSQAINQANLTLITEEAKEKETAYRNTIQKLELAIEAKPTEVGTKRHGMETKFDQSIAKSMQSLANIKSLSDLNYSDKISSLEINLDEAEKKIEILEDLLASYRERHLESAEEFEGYQVAHSAAMAMLHDKLEIAAEEKKRLLAKLSLQIEWYEAENTRLDNQIAEQDIEIERQCAESDQLKAFMVEIMHDYSKKCAQTDSKITSSENKVELDTLKVAKEPILMVPEFQTTLEPNVNASEKNQCNKSSKPNNDIVKSKNLQTVKEETYEREIAELKVSSNVMVFFIKLQQTVAEMNWDNQSTEILKQKTEIELLLCRIIETDNYYAKQSVDFHRLQSIAAEREIQYSSLVAAVENHKLNISQLEFFSTKLKEDNTKLILELGKCQSELASLKVYAAGAKIQSEQSKTLIEEQQCLITELNKRINEISKTLELTFRGEQTLLLLFPSKP